MRKHIYEVVMGVGRDNWWVGLVITVIALALFSWIAGEVLGVIIENIN